MTFLTGWAERSRGLQDISKVTADQAFVLVCSTLGWDWDIDDVGLAPSPHNGERSALQGMYVFLAETIAKLHRGELT